MILGLGISLIPGVMNWTATGIHIELTEFIDETVYQVGMKPVDYGEAGGYRSFLEAEQYFVGHPWVRRIDRILSTVCIVNGWQQDTDSYPLNQPLYYVDGFKDARVILSDPEMIEIWKPLFKWRGDFRVSSNETVVSKTFIDYLELTNGRRVDIGDVIDIDIVLGAHGLFPNMEGNRRYPMLNLTIVGVYELVAGTRVFSNAFISLERKLVDPFAYPQPVLGVMDSIIVSSENIPTEVIDELTTRSFFSVSSLIQANPEGLLAEGESNIPANLMSMMDVIGEPEGLESWGLQEVENLESHINTYLQSRLLILLTFPVLFISLVLMVNAAEASVLRRKNESSLLRTKGASFNQIMSSYLWESLVLFVAAITLGLLLSVFFSSVIGSTKGIFIFDYAEFAYFSSMFVIHPLGIAIAIIVGLSLPITYLLQIGRFIDTDELIIQKEVLAESIETRENLGRLGIVILLLVSSVLIMPYLIPPIGLVGVAEILILTVLLYISAFYGARLSRQSLAMIAVRLSFLLGEKSLYLSRSLGRRKGRLLPLLVILTLILSSTNMLLIEFDGFHHNLDLEVDYAIGADLRIEIDNGTLDLVESFKHIPSVVETMPVIELQAQVGESQFFLEGVRPEQYSRIGHFREDSFSTNSSERILSLLESVPNGVILSEYYGHLWNKSLGDEIGISYFRPEIGFLDFVIIGFMESAPGFGMSSTEELPFGSIASGFGFQIGRGGFALANFDFLRNQSSLAEINLFLGKLLTGTNLDILSSTLHANFNAEVYAPSYSNPREISRSVDLYLSGFESVVSISVVLLGLMGIFAILTLLSAAVRERAKEYGLLKAVGARNDQVVSLVFQEFAGVVIAAMAVSLVIGAALGMTLSILAFGISPMWSTLPHPPYLPLLSLLILSIVELVVLSIACLIPARQALSESPSEALRNL